MPDGPVHKGIFPYIHPLPPIPNFPFMIYPAQIVWSFQSVPYSLPCPFSKVSFVEQIAFYTTPEFPISDSSYNVQIWPLSFLPCLTPLFFLPCTDPSTRPHTQELGVPVTCRLNFWYYYFPFLVLLWNVVLSKPFSLCSLHDLPNLSCCVRLFICIYNRLLLVLTCPLSNNLVDPLPGSGEADCLILLGFIFIAFLPAHSPNLSTSFCNDEEDNIGVDNVITIMENSNMVQSLWLFLLSKNDVMDSALESNEISKNLLRNHC